jgi:hypothetical protein
MTRPPIDRRLRSLPWTLCLALATAASGCATDQPQTDLATVAPDYDPQSLKWLRLDDARRDLADAPALTIAERDEVLTILRASGVDVTNARFYAEDWVLADDHVLYDARRVLHEAELDVEKGYFWTGATPVSRYWDIQIGSDGNYPLDVHFLTIVSAAITEWNDKTNILFTDSQTQPGPVLMLQMGDFGAGNQCLAGLATGPTGGQPGTVALNSGFNCPDPAIPAACRKSSLWDLGRDQKVHIATHEIGHALGFAHPADPSSSRIIFTRSAPNANNPNYPSVMWGGPNGCFTGSGNVVARLSSDDVTSANRKYP